MSREILNAKPAVTLQVLFGIEIVDTEGIPLNSNRAAPELIAEIDFDLKPCPFHDSPSRTVENDHNVPVSGLEIKRLSDNFPEILRLIGGFSLLHRDLVDSADSAMSNDDLMRVLSMGLCLPHYLHHVGGPDRLITPAVVVLSNSSAGASAGVGNYLNLTKQPEVTLLAPTVDPKLYLEATESMGRMVDNLTVCAASPPKIRRFIGRAIHPEERDASAVDTYLSAAELGRYILFCESYTQLKTAVNSLRVFKSEDVDEFLGGGPGFIRLIATLGFECTRSLDALNMSLGRQHPEKAVNLQQLAQAIGNPEIDLVIAEIDRSGHRSSVDALIQAVWDQTTV